MLKIYLDTSILSVAEFDDSGDRWAITLDLLERVKNGDDVEGYVSPVVEMEILNTPDTARRTVLLRRLQGSGAIWLEPKLHAIRIGQLVEAYHLHRCVPPKKLEDALHVAIASVFLLDVVVTWNYRHLAGVEREVRFQTVHEIVGQKHTPRLVTPWELQK